MKKFQVLLILAMVFSLICQTVSEDAGSEEKNNNKKRAISYQSMITDNDGNLIEDGKYLVTFRLYDSETAEDAVWFENQQVTIKDGILDALIGNKKRLEPGHFIDELWLTLEINKEESEKQYIGAASYSMYAGLVDIDAFVAGENIGLAIDSDGRIVIDYIYPQPIPDLVTKSLTFGNISKHPQDPEIILGEYLTMNNKAGTQIGSFMHNQSSNLYKGGDDFDDFVIYAKEGRDLVLKSDITNGDVFIGGATCPNNLTVTGGLTVDGAVNFSSSTTQDIVTNKIQSEIFKFGYTYPDYDFSIFHNQDGAYVGGVMFNKGNDWYKGGSDFDDFVLYAYNGNDLVLKSNQKLGQGTETAGSVFVGTKSIPNDLTVTGELIIKGAIGSDYVEETTRITEREIYTGGANNWLFSTPDEVSTITGLQRQDLYITNALYSNGDWSRVTTFYENGDFEVNGNIIGKKDLNVSGNLTVGGVTNFGIAIQNNAEIKDIKLGYDDNTGSYEFLRFTNHDNLRVGGLMWNDANPNYQAGLSGNDFILYSYDGRDLSLRSSSGTAYVGGTSISDRNLKTGGQNSWVFHTPDEVSTITGLQRQDLYITNALYSNGDWSRVTTFYENGDLEVNGDVLVGKDEDGRRRDLIVTGDLSVNGTINGTFNGEINTDTAELKDLKFGYNGTGWKYEFLRMKNQADEKIGGIMYNKVDGSDGYKGGDDYDDFVVYAYDSRDLVLKSNKTYDEIGNVTNENGNVFVGTESTPNDLYVTGKIVATEVEVKLDVFPDYVFKDDYNLLSLSEVEEHINSHGRLPGMPSEEEVVENGLNLNEMQLMLVEKIEELTLHMISLKKENVEKIEELSLHMTRLEKENKELRNKIDSVIQ